jgi:DNA mismatch endonuclease (patch repair protein)
MADVFTKKQRSQLMSRIRSVNTRPELLLRRYLFSKGFRYRIHQRSLPGNPDLVLKKYSCALFIHGCFWHGHTAKSCTISRMPKSNVEFWRDKFTYNQMRDRKNQKNLKKAGWNIIIVWECQLRGKKKSATLQKLVDKIKQLS